MTTRFTEEADWESFLQDQAKCSKSNESGKDDTQVCIIMSHTHTHTHIPCKELNMFFLLDHILEHVSNLRPASKMWPVMLFYVAHESMCMIVLK